MVKIQYIRLGGLTIPKLKCRPMGVSFPLMDYAQGKPLPQDQQIIEVEKKEADDLVRQGHFMYVVEKKVAKKKESEE